MSLLAGWEGLSGPVGEDDRGGALRLGTGRGPAQGGLRWLSQCTGPSVQSAFHRSMETF